MHRLFSLVPWLFVVFQDDLLIEVTQIAQSHDLLCALLFIFLDPSSVAHLDEANTIQCLCLLLTTDYSKSARGLKVSPKPQLFRIVLVLGTGISNNELNFYQLISHVCRLSSG